MIIFKKYSLAILIISAYGISVNGQLNKKPLMVSSAMGSLNNTYSLVQTTIYKGKQEVKQESKQQVKEESALESIPEEAIQEASKTEAQKNIITRAQLDILGPNKQSTKPLEVQLEVPVLPVALQTYGAPQIVGKIAEFVGAIGGPKGQIAGKAIAGVSALADLGIFIAEQELNKMYGNQEYYINLLEILPTKYYKIDTATQKVDLTKDFEEDLPKYKEALNNYLSAFKEYRQYETVYTQAYRKLQATDPSGKNNPAGWETLRKFDADSVQPVLTKKNKLEDTFAHFFPMHRIAIMASPSTPGNTCNGAGSGPWEFYIIYYLGAKQTNQIAVKYCVPNTKDFQRVIINLVKNLVQQVNPKYNQQKFIPGGIQIQSQSNSNFAQPSGVTQGGFGAQQTEVFNWFTKMVTSSLGESINDFFIPFDVHAIREEYQKKFNETKDAKVKAVLDTLDSAAQAIPDLAKEIQKSKEILDKEALARQELGTPKNEAVEETNQPIID